MAYQELSALGYSIIANVMCGEKSGPRTWFGSRGGTPSSCTHPPIFPAVTGVLVHKGDLSSLASGDTSGLLVRCCSPCCAGKPLLLSSREGAIFTPNGFESHSGMARVCGWSPSPITGRMLIARAFAGMSHRKKWRDTLRVMGPSKASETLGRWLARQVPGLEQHPGATG